MGGEVVDRCPTGIEGFDRICQGGFVRNSDNLIIGGPGSGKTTLGRCLLYLEKLTKGSIFFEEFNLGDISSAQLNTLRKEMQIVFQDPYASLNPRMTCAQIIGEPLKVHHIVSTKDEYEIRIKQLL